MRLREKMLEAYKGLSEDKRHPDTAAALGDLAHSRAAMGEKVARQSVQMYRVVWGDNNSDVPVSVPVVSG